MDSCTHTSPLIDIQPKKTRISMFKRTRTEGRASQFHEFHEFHEPKVAQVNHRAEYMFC